MQDSDHGSCNRRSVVETDPAAAAADSRQCNRLPQPLRADVGGRGRTQPGRITPASKGEPPVKKVIGASSSGGLGGILMRASSSMLPLDVMQYAMRLALEGGQWRAAASIAEKAAPYVHPKMAPRAGEAGDHELTIKIIGGLPGSTPRLPNCRQLRLVHLVGIDDSVGALRRTGSHLSQFPANEVSGPGAIGVNPAVMRVDPLDLQGRVSCRLTTLHRCNCRLSMNGN